MRIAVALSLTALAQLASCLYPAATSGLVADLESCANRSERNVECIRAIKGSRPASQQLQQMRDVMDTLKEIEKGAGVFTRVLVKYDFDEANETRVAELRGELEKLSWASSAAYMRMKAKLDEVWNSASPNVYDEVIGVLQAVNQVCSAQHSSAARAAECIQKMDETSVKSTIERSLESFSRQLIEEVSDINDYLIRVHEGCTQAAQQASSFSVPKPVWQHLNDLLELLQSVKLFLNKMDQVMSRQICEPTISLVARYLSGKDSMTKSAECGSVGDVVKRPHQFSSEHLKAAARAKLADALKEVPVVRVPADILDDVYAMRVDTGLSAVVWQEPEEFKGLVTAACTSRAKEACEAGDESIVLNCEAGLSPTNSQLFVVHEGGRPTTTPTELTEQLRDLSDTGDSFKDAPTGKHTSGNDDDLNGSNGDESDLFTKIGDGAHNDRVSERPATFSSYDCTGDSGYFGSYYGSSDGDDLDQAVCQLKRLVRFMNDQQVGRFIAGLRRVLRPVGHEDACQIIEGIYQALLPRALVYNDDTTPNYELQQSADDSDPRRNALRQLRALQNERKNLFGKAASSQFSNPDQPQGPGSRQHQGRGDQNESPADQRPLGYYTDEDQTLTTGSSGSSETTTEWRATSQASSGTSTTTATTSSTKSASSTTELPAAVPRFIQDLLDEIKKQLA